jgi:hypothetical protein
MGRKLSQGNMITRLGRWLCPALFGPLLSLWAFVTIAVLLGFYEPKWGRFGSWVVGMVFGTLMGGIQGITFLCTDAVLLRFRKRLLPMGARAWLMGLASPFLVFAVWWMWRPGDSVGALFWLRFFAPIVGMAIALRLAFAPRFLRA